jgi:hypothetical protein
MLNRLDTSILFHSDRFISLHLCNGRCATNKYFQIIGSIHDIESYFGIDNTSSLNVQIFFSHWGHLAIIFLWVSRNLFHIGWNGNYELWVLFKRYMQQALAALRFIFRIHYSGAT